MTKATEKTEQDKKPFPAFTPEQQDVIDARIKAALLLFHAKLEVLGQLNPANKHAVAAMAAEQSA
jgi:hypothetical protein